MSYNIDSVEYISGKLRINRKTADELFEKYKDSLPEGCFLSDITDGPEEDVVIDNPDWSGTLSGWAYGECLKEILAHTKGKAKLLFIWEGGDSKTALIVKDGTVTEGKVTISVK